MENDSLTEAPNDRELLSLYIFLTIRTAQLQHGLRHGDYERYRHRPFQRKFKILVSESIVQRDLNAYEKSCRSPVDEQIAEEKPLRNDPNSNLYPIFGTRHHPVLADFLFEGFCMFRL